MLQCSFNKSVGTHRIIDISYSAMASLKTFCFSFSLLKVYVYREHNNFISGRSIFETFLGGYIRRKNVVLISF